MYVYSFDVLSVERHEKAIHLYSIILIIPQTETRNVHVHVHVCSLRHSVATQRPTAIK